MEPYKHTLAIIPARGGSKGLPRKNVRLLGDLPLIAHTIKAATHSRLEHVIVSTDDEEIAGISRRYGADIPFLRPPEFSGDSATSLSVLLHAVEFMETKQKMRVEHVIFLQPTSPFRTAWHLDQALERYFSLHTTSLISVTDVQEFHPYFMFSINELGVMSPLFEMENRPLRRQDLPAFYRINGAIYITRRDYYRNIEPTAAIFDWNSLSAYPMDAPSSVDINDYLDFQKAELLLKERSE
jgi:CMP-N,N'-diacetyllegionaminic acid synthase